jgi:hypothetical protein
VTRRVFEKTAQNLAQPVFRQTDNTAFTVVKGSLQIFATSVIFHHK